MEQLRRVPLGRGDMRVTPLGFGGAPLGNLYAPVAEENALDAVHAAYDAQIRYFDTAPLYGHGMSEHRCGQALRRYPRDSFVLSTKVGRLLRPRRSSQYSKDEYVDAMPFDIVFDYSYDGAMRSFEDSLQRLGTNRIDILLVHDIDARSHGVDGMHVRMAEAEVGALRALQRLRDERVVNAVGIGVNEIEPCIQIAQRFDIDCILLAGRYSLLDQTALDELFPLCMEHRIRVIIGGPFNSGILATGAVPGARFDYAPASTLTLERVRRIEAICARHDAPLAAVALQFPFAHDAVVAVIPGARSKADVLKNKSLLQTSVSPDVWRELKHEGLLHVDAPCPKLA